MLTQKQLLEGVRWRKLTETQELDARKVSPLRVLLACHLSSFNRLGVEGEHGFSLYAEYRGLGVFGRWGGGPLDNDLVPTHWCWPLPVPKEKEMLEIALLGKLPYATKPL